VVASLRFDAGALPLSTRDLQRILAGWADRIPVGDQLRPGEGAPVPERLLSMPLSTRSLEHVRDRRAARQLGALGEGNHFVELDRDIDGNAWLLVHTGSRGLGGAIGRHHASAAAHVVSEVSGVAPDPVRDAVRHDPRRRRFGPEGHRPRRVRHWDAEG
jgi:tRNA-splicing ligase RtcB